MPLFDSSSSTILCLTQGYYLFEVMRESIYLKKLGFSEQTTNHNQNSSIEGEGSKLINYLKNNPYPYMFRVSKISLNSLNFLKTLWTERHASPSCTEILLKTLLRNQVYKNKLIDRLNEKIVMKKHEQRKFEEQVDRIEIMQDFLDFIGKLRTYQTNFNLFCDIIKEIETFLVHSESLKKKVCP